MGKIKIIVGINDLATTRPDVAKLLKNKEDGYKHVAGAAAYVWFQCPVCGHTVRRQIADMCKRNFVCPECKYGSKKTEKHPKTLSQEEFLKRVHKHNPDIFTDDLYINNKTDMVFYCSKNHHWTTKADAVMYQKNGCPYCSGARPIVGETDLGTVRPDVAKLLKNPEDAILYKEYSNKSATFICPNCGHELNRMINNVSSKGLSCDVCGDGISYPNKIMANILSQLHIVYKPEYIINPKKYKYDFFLPDYNIIIEMHGMQHYEESTLTSRTLVEEKENDKLKYEYAIKNNVEHYIVIDSRKSELVYIKSNILNSDLGMIFDLSVIDWDRCELYASGSAVMMAANLYKEGVAFSGIMENLNASKSAVTTWLNKADSIGLIHWDKHNGFKDLCREIVLLNTHEVFKSIAKGAKKYNVNPTNVAKVCHHERRYAGIHPDTGNPLVWRFLEEYDANEIIDFSSIRIRNTHPTIQN